MDYTPCKNKNPMGRVSTVLVTTVIRGIRIHLTYQPREGILLQEKANDEGDTSNDPTSERKFM